LTRLIPVVYTSGMNKVAVINLKTDPKLKAEAMELADTLGVSLSQVLNQSLKQFTATRQFTAIESYTPTPELIAIIERSKKSGNKTIFSDEKSALDFLKTL